MKLKLRQVGKSIGRPASFIELIIEADNSIITTDVTKLSGLVDVELIHTLRQIADDLEEQNTLVNEKDN